MRLATIQTPAGPRAAVVNGSEFIDVYATEPKLPSTVRELLESWAAVLPRLTALANRPDAVRHANVRVTLLPPIPDPRKIVCIGLNYRDHAAESGATIPSEPILFSKYATALVGHEAPIVLPRVSREVDYEAELVAVIGKRGRHVPVAEAWSHVAGYCIGHDVSARDWQLKKEGRQWMVGKTFDTFAPCGPVLVTADEVPDPQALPIRLMLNGQSMQESNTSQMIFNVASLIAYVSTVFTLEPGDLIFTGTPHGVGFTRKPPVFLQPGDVVEISIGSLGVLRNQVIAEFLK